MTGIYGAIYDHYVTVSTSEASVTIAGVIIHKINTRS